MNAYRHLALLALLAPLAVPLVVQSKEHLGTPAPAKSADRTVVLQPDSQYMKVDRGEVVTLVYKDKSFTWKFDTFGLPTFRLSEIAPNDFDAADVRIDVFPHPLFDATG